MNSLPAAIAVWCLWLAPVLAQAAASAAPPASTTPPTTVATTTATSDAPPVATGPKLTNFAGTVFEGIVGESAPEVSLDFAAGATVGAMPLILEKTTLDQLQQSFGGLIHAQGSGTDAVSWLCFTQHAATKRDTPTTVWFASTVPAPAASGVSLVVAQRVDASKASGCATAPKGFAFPAFGVPGLGATLADLKGRFGVLKRDRQGNAYFDSIRALGDGSGRSVYQTLGYAIGKKKGRVSGIALSQTTTD